MNDSQYALLQSLFCFGGLIGALVGGPMQDKFGRKTSFLIIDCVFILSAAVTYFYAIGVFGEIDRFATYMIFWFSRFLVGLACGCATAVVPTYLGEIAPAVIRGTIGTSNQLTICFGVVIVEVIGYKTIFGGQHTWQYLFVANALPIIQLLTIWSFPESPKWLVQQTNIKQAKKSLIRLRQTQDVTVDLMLMRGGVEHESKPKINENENEKETALLSTITINEKKEKKKMSHDMWTAVKWATIIAICLMLMQQLSGINAVFYYSSTILKHAGLKSHLAIWLGSVAISVANFFAVFIAVIAIDRAGRKILLIVSSVVMLIAGVLVSIAIMFESHGAFWQYSSIAFLVLFVVGFEIGLGAIPWVMMAELAPMQYRGPIVAIATASNWASNLIIAQFSASIIADAYFYPFCVVSFLGILFTIKCIPETNGKTANQIQQELASK